MADDVVVAQNLSKEFAHGPWAVRNISFRIRRQECFGFLGPNGAGKSSTVKMIYCASPPTGGELLVLGLDPMKDCRRIKARLGVVAQEDNLDPDLTVWENLLVYASFFQLPRQQACIRATELLDFFELMEKRNTRVENLSGGMKRKLTIARALVHRPELLILDEPTTGLDPAARQLVWQRLRFLKEQGVTLLLTTHYLEEASYLCDRLVIMAQGQILEEGAPAELVHCHIGPEVLEVGLTTNNRDEVLNLAMPYISGYQVVQETLFLYPRDGRFLRELLGRRFTGHLLLRPANLEDVFFKLTGRGLNHDN